MRKCIKGHSIREVGSHCSKGKPSLALVPYILALPLWLWAGHFTSLTLWRLLSKLGKMCVPSVCLQEEVNKAMHVVHV